MSAADIIGILSSALHAAHKLYDIIQLIKNAPEDMDALQIEVSRVRGILAQNIDTSGDARGGADSSESVRWLRHDLTEQARKWIEAANQFVEKATTVKEDGTRKVNRALWPFKASDAKKLAEESKAFYLAVCAVFFIDTSAKIALLEPSVLAIGDQTVSAVGEQITYAVDHAITPAMERLLVAQEARLTHFFTHQLTIVSNQQRDGHHQLFDELNPLRGNAEIVHGLPARSLSLTDSNESLTPFSPSRGPGPSTTMTHTGMQTISTSVVSQSLHPTSLPDNILPPYSMLGPLRRRCPLDCRCRCHKRSNDYRLVPHALRSWIGDIRIPQWLMTSLASSARPCDDPKCVQTRETLSVVKWYLPKWFAQVHTEIALQSLPIHFVIQTPRTVKSLRFIYELSFEEVKMKLSTRELTVNDVEPNGLTVLHAIAYMIVYYQRSDAHEMMRYLILDAGAPQDWEYGGHTVAEYVTATPAASVHLRSFEYNVTRPLFEEDIEDTWERIRTKRGWSDLHYLVAHPPSSPGRLRTDLARILAQPDAALHLNALDRHGWTPLRQAIYSCPDAVDTLLRAGANLYLINASLGDAVQALSWRAIGLLIRAAANVNKRYRRLADGEHGTQTALHDVIRFDSALGPGGRLPCALELVRHAGHVLDWDVGDEGGDTPLWWAEWRMKQHPDDGDVASIYQLYKTRRLPLGAQFVDRSRLGDEAEVAIHLESTSLIKAGLAGNVPAVGELINAGAMVNERDASGRTLLHLVAMGVVPNGYAVALELVRHGWYGVDWDAVTIDGQTAEELAQETLECLLTFWNADPGETSDEDDYDDRGDSDVEVDDGAGSDGALEADNTDENADNDSVKTTKNDDNNDDTAQNEEYIEAIDILFLLQYRALPQSMKYVYPCMDPDYCDKCSLCPCSGYCSNGLRMPGGFDCD